MKHFCKGTIGSLVVRNMCRESHIALVRQECHNSKFGVFYLLVWKEMFADAL